MRMLTPARAIASAVLVVAACLLVPVASTAVWLRTTVTDTDRYVATVAPLAQDPLVETYVSDLLHTQLMAAVDRSGVLGSGSGRQVLANGVRSLTDAVVGSDAFAQAWRESNATAHGSLMRAVAGGGVSGGLDLDLATLANTVRLAMIDNEVPFADRVPEVRATIPLANEDQLGTIRELLDALDTWAVLLVALAVICPAAGIALARRRRRSLALWLVGSALAAALALVGLVIGREVLTSGLPDGGAVAGAVVDVLTARLRSALGAWVALLLVAAAVVVLTGPDPRATSLRARARGTLAGMRSGR